MTKDSKYILAIIVTWFGGFGIGIWAEKTDCVQLHQKQIVEHGCAEYYLDQNHLRQWRWKDCK